jgi:hypothetical protein
MILCAIIYRKLPPCVPSTNTIPTNLPPLILSPTNHQVHFPTAHGPEQAFAVAAKEPSWMK